MAADDLCTCGHRRGGHRNEQVPIKSWCTASGCECERFSLAVASGEIIEEAGDSFPVTVSVTLESAEEAEHLQHLLTALATYRERDKERRGGWRRAGVRGMSDQIFSKAERGFIDAMNGVTPNPDHYIDLINYAVFAMRLRDNLNGEWPWPNVTSK